MALVASPTTTSVWRDPNVMSASAVSNLEQSPSLLPLHPVSSSADVGVYQFMGGIHAPPAITKRENPPTPTPPMADTESIIKDEHGQEIACVVCGDKSSGKHYGQFTCEGKIFVYFFTLFFGFVYILIFCLLMKASYVFAYYFYFILCLLLQFSCLQFVILLHWLQRCFLCLIILITNSICS